MVLRGASEVLLEDLLCIPMALNALCRAHCPVAVLHTCQVDAQQADIHCLILSIFKIKDVIEDYTYIQFKIC